jgi:hypothetical protein
VRKLVSSLCFHIFNVCRYDEGEATDEKEKAVEDAAAAASDFDVMPNRDALKRRLLRLLDLLINPRAELTRKPTKAELVAETKKKAAEERLARDAVRMKRDRERFEASLQGKEPAREEEKAAAGGGAAETTPKSAKKARRTSLEGGLAAPAAVAAAAVGVRCSPRKAPAAAAAAAAPYAVKTPATATKAALTADQEPLTSLVLPGITGGVAASAAASAAAATPSAAKPPAAAAAGPSAFKTPSAGAGAKGKGGGKGKGAKASLAAAAASGKQASLFGFFSKTPAAAAERPSTVATPTTGGFA